MSSDDEDKGQEQQVENELGVQDEALERSTPFTIVWTTLPVISWVLPFIGHTGVTE
jgi:hypothetical protein